MNSWAETFFLFGFREGRCFVKLVMLRKVKIYFVSE